MVEQSTNNIFENVYKFNGKELDESTGYYYYGARYYDLGASIFLSVDPLAEQFPAWTPYHYVHQNPINMIDPTGMSADGWIQHETQKGEKLLTYDSRVNTVEEAKSIGYKNIQGVSETMAYHGTNGLESFALNSDGSVTDNLSGTTTDVGFTPIRTGEGYYISENNEMKSFAKGLQDGGNWSTTVGLGLSITGFGAPVGGAMMTIGGFMSLAGTIIESGFMINRGENKNAVVNLGVSLIFARSGNYGIKAAERAIGKGLSRGGTTLINGINYTMEETIGADTKEWLMK